MRKTLGRLMAAMLMLVTMSAQANAAAGLHPKQLASALHARAPNISARVIARGITAYQNAVRRHFTDKPLITIVDYALSSNKKRLLVVDLTHGTVLFYTYVAHGKGSGDEYATRFSNARGSKASSLGVYLTGKTYTGKHGYSLRLKGMNPDFNGNAYQRAIVIHAADYVSPAFAKKYGRMGRSWGCFAVAITVERDLVRAIRGGTLLMAYYPDRQWLRESPFLKPQAAR